MNATNKWYSDNAQAYIERTGRLSMGSLYDEFLTCVPKIGDEPAYILDIGPGSGRDMSFFKSRGYDVEGIEPCAELAEAAARRSCCTVEIKPVQMLADSYMYHGIWACASLLHVPKAETPDVYNRIARALRMGGTLYTTYQLGDGERMGDDGRFYYDMTELGLSNTLDAAGFTQLKIWQTKSVDPKSSRVWVNALAVK